MNGYFVTGTDTDVGKTVVSAVLTYILRACYWKPIQSGIADSIPDIETVRQLTEFSAEHFHPSTYMLKASLAPEQAATKEGIMIDIGRCQPPITDKPLIVEGAGGIYVPLNDSQIMLDLIKKLNLPVIIVARGTLGTINHTLLTIEGLRQNNIPIHGIVFNGKLNPANQKAIEKWGQVKTLFHVPLLDKIDAPTVQRWIYEFTFAS
ncbi:MAG TPA: dethiobiotin synthase [Gammaproteobacteria bacterium]|nr:dethiobiotin synthase [Gammaproteobacteria bacterium]